MSISNGKLDYYKILELKTSATLDEIKKSYRKLAIKYHPDKNRDKSPEEQIELENNFKSISVAYEVLSDTEKRKEYDSVGNSLFSFTFNPTNPNDIFNEFFNDLPEEYQDMSEIFVNAFTDSRKDGLDVSKLFTDISEVAGIPTDVPGFIGFMGNRIGKKLKKSNSSNSSNVDNTFSNKQNFTRDIILNVPIDIDSAFMGKKKKISVKRQLICSVCSGTKFVRKNCELCVNEDNCQECPNCRNIKSSCSNCNGEGYIIDKKIVNFSTNLSQVCLRGESNQIMNKKQGDIIINTKININKSGMIRVDNFNLQKTVKISLYEYLYGVNFNIKTLDNRILNIKKSSFYTPPNTTKSLDLFLHKIKNEGIPYSSDNLKKRGDLIIKFEFDLSSQVDPEAIKILYPPLNK